MQENNQGTIDSFKEKLDNEYEWPSLYTFKFIVPKEKKQEVINIFSNHETSEKASSKGTYVSVSCKVMASSSDSIISYYLQASKIEGVIAL